MSRRIPPPKTLAIVLESIEIYLQGPGIESSNDRDITATVVRTNSDCALRFTSGQEIDTAFRGLVHGTNAEIEDIGCSTTIYTPLKNFPTRATVCESLGMGEYSLLMCNIGLHLSLCTGVAQMTTIGGILKKYVSYETVQRKHAIKPDLQKCLQEILSADPDRVGTILDTFEPSVKDQVPRILSLLAFDLYSTGVSVTGDRFRLVCPEIGGFSNIVSLPLTDNPCLSSLGEIFAIMTTQCLQRAPYVCGNALTGETTTNGGAVSAKNPTNMLPPAKTPSNMEAFHPSLKLHCNAVEIRVLYYRFKDLRRDLLPPEDPDSGAEVPGVNGCVDSNEACKESSHRHREKKPLIHSYLTPLPDPEFRFNRVNSCLSSWIRRQSPPTRRSYILPGEYSENNKDIIRVFVDSSHWSEPSEDVLS